MRLNRSWQQAPAIVRLNVEALIQDAVKSRANSTIQTYVRTVKKLFQWCRTNNIQLDLPLHPATIAMYIHKVSRTRTSVSSLNIVYAALKWLHSLIPYRGLNPVDNDFCKTMLQAARRKVGRPISKKRPVSASIVREIIDKYASAQSNLKELRTAAFCTLGFAGFLRFDELRTMNCNQIHLHDEYMEIILPKSKTDVYREGNVIYIARSKTKYCPVRLLLRYMGAANIDGENELPLFRQLTFHKKTNTYTLRTSSLSYTSCREMFKDALKSLGYDPKEYGLHSLRSGGITEVVQNSNNTISERLLKLHGRWKTDHAKDMYVQESISNRLKVTRCLSL